MNETDETLLFPAPTADDVARCKASNKRVLTFTTAGHTLLCKPMSRATWKRIQAMQSDPDDKGDVTETIWLDTLLYPAREKLDLLLEDFPAAFESVAIDLLGIAKGEEAKRGKRV